MWFRGLILAALAAAAMGAGKRHPLCRDLPPAAAEEDPSDPFRCEPSHPRTLLYNRVPKCGSTTLQGITRALGPLNGFDWCYALVFRQRWLSEEEQRLFASLDWCKDPNQAAQISQGVTDSPLLVDRHMFWTNITSESSPTASTAYMNVLRDPISRCKSRYAFEAKRNGWQETLGECMVSGRCDFEGWATSRGEEEERPFGLDATGSLELLLEECSGGYLTRWFCGMDETCRRGHPEALPQAKRRLVQDYAFVGLLSEMERSVAVLDLVLPDFFRFAAALPPTHINRSPQDKAHLSPQQERVLRELNADDLELYVVAEAAFWRRVGRCCADRTAPDRLRAQKRQLKAAEQQYQFALATLKEYGQFF